MLYRRTRRGGRPWRPDCQKLEGRRLLSLDLGSFGLGDLGLDPPDDGIIEGPSSSLFDPGMGPMMFGAPPPSFFDPGMGGEVLNIVNTIPSHGAVLRETSRTVAVQFDRVIDPFSLFKDLALYRVLGDERLEPVFAEHEAPFTQLDPLDPTRVFLDLDSSLQPGNYRLKLDAGSFITGADGSTLASQGVDQWLADFEVARPGVTLDDATPLNRPLEPVVQIVSGTLDFNADPSAVALYKLTISPSHRLWRLGVEVSAQRDGSPLDAALTLFDDQGHVLRTAEFGRSDAPRDPYLFAGLKAGTYYVGVSGHGNLSGEPGGYDPVTGDPGSISQSHAGGGFRLHLVADPVAAPEMLVGFRLQRADRNSLTPTGFDLQFSGVVLPGNGTGSTAEGLAGAIEVVDQNGKTWPVVGVNFDETQATLSFIFLDRLPAGRYSIRLADSGGLVDLTGRAPMARRQADGLMANFVVPPRNRPQDPDDFGAVYKDAATEGLTLNPELQPGESRTYRFVLLQDTEIRYTALTNAEGLRAGLVRQDSGQPFDIETGAPGENRNGLVIVSAGEYEVRLHNNGSDTVQVDLILMFFGRMNESLQLNGVGQGPALELRLIAPSGGSLHDVILTGTPTFMSGSGGNAPYPIAPPQFPGMNPAPGAPPTRGTLTDALGVSSAAEAWMALNTNPVGLPGGAEELPLADTAASSTLAAMTVNNAMTAFGDPSEPLSPEVSNTYYLTASDASPGNNPDNEVPLPDEAGEEAPPLTVAALSDLDRLLARILDGMPSLAAPDPGMIVDQIQASLTGEAFADAEDGATIAENTTGEPGVATSSLEMPVGLSLFAVITYQFRESISRWFHKPSMSRRKPQGSERYTPKSHLGLSQLRQRT